MKEGDNMKKIICTVCSLLCISSFIFCKTVGGKLPKGAGTSIEDFEEGYVWVHAGEDWEKWEGKHHHAIGAELVHRWKTNGKYSVELQFDYITEEDHAMWYTDFPATETLDFSNYNCVAFDVYNPEKYDLILGIAFQNLEWDWLQLLDVTATVPTGEHTVVLDISGIPPEKRVAIRRIIFEQTAVTPGEGHFYLDNLRAY